jgi:hypothetical protein
MRINRVSNITFKETEQPRNIESQNAILMLRDKNASVKFQQNKEVAKKADALNTNPLTALGYKLYRTFSLIRDNEPVETEGQKHLNTLA